MDARSLRWLVGNALLWLVVGSAGTLLIERMSDRRPTLGDLADLAVARMRTLDLTDAQKASLAQIRAEWRSQIVAEEQAWLDRLDQAAVAADSKVAGLLTPEQAQRYRELALAPRSK